MIDLAALDEEDEDQAVDEDDFMPAQQDMDDAGRNGKRKSDHLLGPSCPICGESLGPSTSNQELNDHVDWCLNKDAIQQAGKVTPKKPKRPKPPDRKPGDRGMLQWLKKDPVGK